MQSISRESIKFLTSEAGDSLEGIPLGHSMVDSMFFNGGLNVFLCFELPAKGMGQVKNAMQSIYHFQPKGVPDPTKGDRTPPDTGPLI